MAYVVSTLPCPYCDGMTRTNMSCACSKKKEDMVYKSSRDVTFTSCFISPSGTFYPVPYSGHSHFARQWSLDDTDPVGDLERRGWFHISEEDGYVGVWTDRYDTNVSQGQVDVLFSMLMDCHPALRARFMIAVRRYVPDFGIVE